MAVLIIEILLTFRCDAADFHLAKSHKKVLKNFNNFLQNGKDVSNRCGSIDSESVDVEKTAHVEQSTEANESSASEEIKMITSNPRVQIDIENALEIIEVDSKSRFEMDTNNNGETIPNGSVGMETSSMKMEINDDRKLNEEVQTAETNGDNSAAKVGKPQLKAKFLRQQRKAVKQMANAECEIKIGQKLLSKKVPKSAEKTLKTFIEEMPTNGKHKLKVCIR